MFCSLLAAHKSDICVLESARLCRTSHSSPGYQPAGHRAGGGRQGVEKYGTVIQTAGHELMTGIDAWGGRRQVLKHKGSEAPPFVCTPDAAAVATSAAAVRSVSSRAVAAGAPWLTSARTIVVASAASAASACP